MGLTDLKIMKSKLSIEIWKQHLKYHFLFVSFSYDLIFDWPPRDF